MQPRRCHSGMAEGVGFEPTEGRRPSTVFKTAPINRSGTPPLKRWHAPFHADIVYQTSPPNARRSP